MLFKQILKGLAQSIGVKKLLLIVWEIADDDLKAAAAKTPTKADDEVVKYLDIGIRTYCASEL